jgi:hypothetical protein
MSKSIIEDSIRKNIYLFILISKYIEFKWTFFFYETACLFCLNIIFYFNLNMFILLMKIFISH